ncbi:type II toxin-antitoxin system CcdA family antitoxin [Paracoccus litorisediminis]|uniref:type II toxin-antitoxin system CcdA family antitoxin n=1 Tax=Paracoccus litorisediminis TaxID=2006130 RepID=UPI00372DAF1B
MSGGGKSDHPHDPEATHKSGQIWRNENAAAIAASNGFVEENGLPLSGISVLKRWLAGRAEMR